MTKDFREVRLRIAAIGIGVAVVLLLTYCRKPSVVELDLLVEEARLTVSPFGDGSDLEKTEVFSGLYPVEHVEIHGPGRLQATVLQETGRPCSLALDLDAASIVGITRVRAFMRPELTAFGEFSAHVVSTGHPNRVTLELGKDTEEKDEIVWRAGLPVEESESSEGEGGTAAEADDSPQLQLVLPREQPAGDESSPCQAGVPRRAVVPAGARAVEWAGRSGSGMTMVFEAESRASGAYLVDPAGAHAPTPVTLPFPFDEPEIVDLGELLLVVGGSSPPRPRRALTVSSSVSVNALWNEDKTESWLVEGTIGFPEAERSPIEIGEGWFLSVDPAAAFELKSAQLEGGHVRLRLVGSVETLRSGPTLATRREQLPDYAATIFRHTLKPYMQEAITTLLGLLAILSPLLLGRGRRKGEAN